MSAAIPAADAAHPEQVRGAGRSRAALSIRRPELAALVAILSASALIRLVNLPSRGGWDSDQGSEMLALWQAIAGWRLPTFGPQALSVGSFHHGALYYDLLLPAAWLGHGDPAFVVAEIALGGLLTVVILWWLARSIGGPAAGIAAALIAAASAALVGYSTFIWNPTLIEPGAAMAVAAAWQAWRTSRARWWVVAAFGADVAMQAHLAAGVLILPLAALFLADLRRSGGARRRRLAASALAALGLVAATYLPLIVYEVGHGFEETRAMLGFFGEPATGPDVNPIARVLFAAIRIVTWPLTAWPETDLRTAIVPALACAVSFYAGLVFLVARAGGTSRRPASSTTPGAEMAAAAEREGIRYVAGSIALLALALGVGLRKVSELNELPTEQYHAVVDPLVIVAAALIMAALWRWAIRARSGGDGAWRSPFSLASGDDRAVPVGRLFAVVLVVALVAWNAVRWPPLTAYDDGWPGAQRAARRVEASAAGTSIAFVAMPAAKGADAYLYPLTRDGAKLEAPDRAGVVVVLCDSYWIKAPDPTCGGPAEEAWRASAPGGGGMILVDRFAAAPDRTLSVYRRSP